jgi:hypothetical protein
MNISQFAYNSYKNHNFSLADRHGYGGQDYSRDQPRQSRLIAEKSVGSGIAERIGHMVVHGGIGETKLFIYTFNFHKYFYLRG